MKTQYKVQRKSFCGIDYEDFGYPKCETSGIELLKYCEEQDSEKKYPGKFRLVKIVTTVIYTA